MQTMGRNRDRSRVTMMLVVCAIGTAMSFTIPSLTTTNSYMSTPLSAFSPSTRVQRAAFQPKPKPRPLPLNEQNDPKENDKKFSMASLFGGASDAVPSLLRGAGVKQNLDPHPSQRPHISQLNLLDPQGDEALVKPLARQILKGEPLPMHPDVRSGVLENGLPYIILPNRNPPGRFEAHLQVFSGSADELEEQQGIAHLTEHVAYMGSRKRERLFGTGSQTNAYTDFHHTVFYAACPTTMPRQSNISMLPFALDALCDVMEARCESSRLEKERQAVLSEMTMVNTIEYRVECQILSTLHRENRLAKRFPIGKEVLINNWNTDNVKTWHRTHYRPDNVLLYVVGDIDPGVVVKEIENKFGHLTAEEQATQINPSVKPLASELATALVSSTVKGAQSWHYPPVIHDWCGPVPKELELKEKANDLAYDINLQGPWPLDEKVQFLETKELAPGKKIRPHIFRHGLLQAFSLHLFAKRPVEPIVDLPSFRKSLARRVALAALQIRMNVGGRSDDPPFQFVEFNQLDSAREGCAVCSLDLTSEPERWQEAIHASVKEIRKLGVHGVTQGEMERYVGAIMTDSAQLSAMGDRLSHGDQLAYLMETVANGHTFMSPENSYVVTEKALATLSLEEVNEAARELCSHIVSFNDECKPEEGPVIVIACSPDTTEASGASHVTEQSLVSCLRDACQGEVEPEEEVIVPHTLIDEGDLRQAMEENPAHWEAGKFTDGTPDTPADKFTRPFTLRRLNNGVRVGISQNKAESQRGYLRLVVPGGRDAEKKLGFKSGSMSVGARAMQEGGAFGKWSREQVELFCVDHLLQVEIQCNEEAIIIDFVFPTTNVGNTGFGEDAELGITGTEAVMQILREIIIGFKWEEDALGRSKSSFRSAHEGLQKNLEGMTTELIMETMTGQDERFLSIDVDTVNAVTLDDAKNAVMSQLSPSELEVSVVGDFDLPVVLEMLRYYIGTVPADTNSEYRTEIPDNIMEGTMPTLSLPGKRLDLELVDSDPRAVAYVAGSAPNLWGYLPDGSTLAERLLKEDKKASDYDKQRRSHPLFSNAVLSLISEITNRRLFSNVRERKQLTYDANFSLTGFERLKGGWFLVTVTASKEKAEAALEACKETIDALRTTSKISQDNIESAKRVVINRHEGELRTARYWAEMMSGLQQESIPLKGPLAITDFNAVVEAITTKDLQMSLSCFGFEESDLYTAIGQTVLPEGYVPPEDDIVPTAPMVGMQRGGALH